MIKDTRGKIPTFIVTNIDGVRCIKNQFTGNYEPCGKDLASMRAAQQKIVKRQGGKLK